MAADGFDALQDLDNNRDSKINSTDSVFANLRIWRDLNQDGISQASELTPLSTNNIISIGVNSSAVRIDLGNGNVQTAAGSFTRSNGTTGTTGETNGTAANLDLLVNTFYRQFTDQITLTDQAEVLPTLHGSGRVRDLSEAISLSPDLGNLVQIYIQQATRQDQIDKLDDFIEKWANTSDMMSLKAQAEALSTNGVKLTYNLAGLTVGTPTYDEFVSKLGIVERFMGFTYGGANGEARFTALDATSGNLSITLTAEQIINISLAYDRFKMDIYESLLLQTRLKEYYKSIVETPEIIPYDIPVFSFTDVEQAFVQAVQTVPQLGIIDLIEFLSAFGEIKLEMLGWNATGFLITQLNNAPDLDAFSEELSSWTVRLAGSTEHNLVGSSRLDLLVGTNTTDELYGRNGNDLLLGKGGSDYIYAGNDNDILDGGLGNDTLSGGIGNDIYLLGIGSGNDTVYEPDASGASGTDQVVFTGLKQADVSFAKTNNTDLIVTIKSTGESLRIINAFHPDTNWGVESFNFINSNVVLKNDGLNITGTNANDILIGDTGDDMLNGAAGFDTLIGGLGDDSYVVDNISDVITERLNEGADYINTIVTYTLSGNIENLTLSGVLAINGTGNSLANIIIGNTAVNQLNGGTGSDTLDGKDGNDTLNGGAGIDVMIGGLGNDNYVVDNVGDVITENLSEGTDKVNSSVTYMLSANVENLTLTGTSAINGTGNSVANVIT